MTPDEALEFFGTKKDMALALNVTSTTVYSFFSKGRISNQCQLKIEILTEGTLKASIKKDPDTGKYAGTPGRPKIIASAVQASLTMSIEAASEVIDVGLGNRSQGMRMLIAEHMKVHTLPTEEVCNEE